MISTVTTSTVSTVTTAAIAGSVALIGVLVLFGLLFTKEMTMSRDRGSMVRLGKSLMIGIIPLLIAFGLILVARIADVLR